MKSQKGIIHIGLVLVLLVLGIGALMYVMYKTNSLPVVTTASPTPNSTPAPITTPEGWLEYDLPGIGLTFFYPADARVDTKASHTLGVGSKYQGPMLVNISKYGQTQGLDTELYDGYSFSIAKIALNSESLQKIAQDSISFNTSEFGQETLIKPLSMITIGGKTGYTYTIQSLGQYTHILLPLDEKSFLLITYSAPDPNNQGYQKIIDQILSTFEFINSNTDANSKLYTNTQAHYSITVLPSWKISALAPGADVSVPPPATANAVQITKNYENKNASIVIEKFTGKQPYDPSTESLFGNLYSATQSSRSIDAQGRIAYAYAVINPNDNESYINVQINYHEDAEILKELNSILATFKFIN